MRKSLAGMVYLLLGLVSSAIFARALWGVFRDFATYQNQDILMKAADLAMFVALGWFAFYALKTGWQLIKKQKPPAPSLGRGDILDDGDLHQKSNNQP